MLKEFKQFALKGNVVDLAVAVIIGGAFGKIITSLVNDIIMPIFGFLLAGTEFTALKAVLSPAELDAAGEVIKAESAIMYGNFIQSAVDFIIIAFCIFLAVKLVSKLHTKAPAEPEPPKGPTQEELLTEIRDLLKENQ